MENAKLTDKERGIIDFQYAAHKRDNMCPHNRVPLQLKTLCKRCRQLEALGINVYQMPECLGSDWAASAEGIISDGFPSRQAAEDWAFNRRERK